MHTPAWLNNHRLKMLLVGFFLVQLALDIVGIFALLALGNDTHPTDGTRALLTILVAISLVESLLGLVVFYWPRTDGPLTAARQRVERLMISVALLAVLAEIGAIIMLQVDLDLSWSATWYILLGFFGIFTILDLIGWAINTFKE